MRRGSAGAVLVVAVGFASACQSPAPPHPLTHQSRYLCCNLHYEHPKINDANYQVGAVVPFGTRVEILAVSRGSVEFRPDGHPAITLVYKYGAKSLPFDQYLDRLFVSQDPRAKLKKVSAKTVQLLQEGAVAPGMTRDQVLMAVGYPPAHQTPSLEVPSWRYWKNRWVQFVVFFDGDKVARLQD